MDSTSVFTDIRFTIVGSLVATLIMDLVMVIQFSLIGMPVHTYLALIGSVVGGSVLEGVPLHFLMGTFLGLVFAAITFKLFPTRLDTTRDGIVLGILVGLITIPLLCVPFAVVTNIPLVDMISFTSIPHLIWGIALGGIFNYRVQSVKART